MTTNIDRAEQVIQGLVDHPETPEIVAQALADAGLLASDLPTVEIDDEGAPYVTVTGCYDDAPGIIRVDADGAFHARNVSSAPTGPAEARERGAAYLALAQHVEGDPRG